ncbi:MAG: hypothetical protein FJ295_09405 [Planctomycetes bacterium]|nr:hypothetical protein [Planctomycetota bacterium]
MPGLLRLDTASLIHGNNDPPSQTAATSLTGGPVASPSSPTASGRQDSAGAPGFPAENDAGGSPARTAPQRPMTTDPMATAPGQASSARSREELLREIELLQRELLFSSDASSLLAVKQLAALRDLQRSGLSSDGGTETNPSSEIVMLRPTSSQTRPQQSPPSIPPAIPFHDSDRITRSQISTTADRSQSLESNVPPPIATASLVTKPVEADSPDTIRSDSNRSDLNRSDSRLSDGSPARTDPEDRKDPPWHIRLQQAMDGLERELASSESGLTEIERHRLEVQHRLLQVAIGQREQALKEIARMPIEQREYWKHQMRTLLLLLDEHATPSQARRAALALRELQAATEHLASQSSLDLHNLTFCSRVDGFGTLTEFAKTEFAPGQEILLYVEIDHFRSEADSGGNELGRRNSRRYETELRGSYQIMNASGGRIADAELPLDKQSCRSPRRDYFIAYHIYLPKNLDPGAYSLQLTIEDVKGKKFGHGSVEFQIKSPAADSGR